jgi:hypothetical protein
MKAIVDDPGNEFRTLTIINSSPGSRDLQSLLLGDATPDLVLQPVRRLHCIDACWTANLG